MTTMWEGPRGKRRRGRLRKKRIEDIKAIPGNEWIRKAKDNEVWKKLEEVFTREGVPINGNSDSNESA